MCHTFGLPGCTNSYNSISIISFVYSFRGKSLAIAKVSKILD